MKKADHVHTVPLKKVFILREQKNAANTVIISKEQNNVKTLSEHEHEDKVNEIESRETVS